jgi:hypothetical protein
MHLARISADRSSPRTLHRELTRGGGSRERAMRVHLRPLGGAPVVLDEVAGDRPVDYLEMDVEGAEREVLTTGTECAARVRLISVELHEPYTVQPALDDLTKLGFEAAADSRHWASVQGIRREL